MKYLSFIVAFLLWPLSTAAQRFYIEVEPRSGTMEDSYRMSIVLEGYNAPRPPLLEGGNDFSLTLLGPSNQVSIVNGVVNSRMSYEYRLIPKKTGALQSPSAEVEVNNQTIKAAAVTVQVSQGTGITSPAGKDVFLQQSINKRRAYVGEQLTNKLELFTSIRLQAPQLMDLTYDDFNAQPIDEDAHYERVIDGKRYQVTALSRGLYPLRSGELTIPARKIQAKVLVRSKSRFPSLGGAFEDDFFAGFFDTAGFEDKVLTSNPLTVSIEELPPLPAGQPTWGLSSPLVGKTSLIASQDSGPVKVGESKLVTLQINSFGNVNSIKEVPLNLGNSAKVYQETPSDTKSIQDEKLLSKRSFKISIVPMKAGVLTLPPFRLPYFDPEAQTYKLVSTEPIEIQVDPNPAFAQSVKEPALKSERVITAESSATPAASPKVSTEPSYEEPTWYERLVERISFGSMSLVILLIVIITSLIYGAIRVSKFQKQKRTPLKQIQTAQDISEAERAFYELLQYRFNLESELLTKAAREEVLRKHVTDSKLQFEILALLDLLQELRFGGKTPQGTEFENLKARLLQSAKKV